jgi:endonuclease YncB( thermonuclease family)
MRVNAFLACTALAGLFGGPVSAEDCPGSGADTAVVAEAVSGDTLRLTDGSVIRLAGVEAPIPPLEPGGDAQGLMAEESRRALAEIAVGQPVRLAWAAGTPDRYGRMHARMALAGGRWLEGLLTEHGFVRVRWLPGEDTCFDDLLSRERVARQAATGLWGDPAYAVLSADDPSLRSRNGLYELVEGRVVSVGHGSRMIFLDFGPDVRHDFTVMVPLAVAEAMMARAVNADTLAGSRVRVRGIVENSGGPAIRINHPAEIELID